MQRGLTGHYIPIPSVGEECRAFVPNPLPPSPPLVWDSELLDLHAQATLALGRLDGLAAILPETGLFLYSYVRKEAVLSAQIEGTQSSLAELLLFESAAAPGVPLDDVLEVSNYVAALTHGLERLKELPVCLRLLREIHAILLAKGRGSDKTPGEFRRSQNWVGGSRPGNASYVPPPPDCLLECLDAFERFLHDQPEKCPLLVKAALAHVQFESIHPFLDGNGRLGRLLITLLLCAQGALRSPLLYLSLYFKQNRQQYYDLLQHVRLTGDWEAWLRFFFKGVRETADQAVYTGHALLKLFEADRKRIEALGRPASSALRVHACLERHPLASISRICEETGLSHPTVTSALRHLERLGIVQLAGPARYGRLFAYHQYLRILSEGTEPLP